MADIDKKIHHAVAGKGGIKCDCCRYGKHKDRTKVARRAKRRARQIRRENGIDS